MREICLLVDSRPEPAGSFFDFTRRFHRGAVRSHIQVTITQIDSHLSCRDAVVQICDKAARSVELTKKYSTISVISPREMVQRNGVGLTLLKATPGPTTKSFADVFCRSLLRRAMGPLCLCAVLLGRCREACKQVYVICASFGACS